MRRLIVPASARRPARPTPVGRREPTIAELFAASGRKGFSKIESKNTFTVKKRKPAAPVEGGPKE